MGIQNCEDFLQKMDSIFEKIKDGENFIQPDYLRDFAEKIHRARTHAGEIINTNRDLKIGIVGQVKAGKSSFLNALIFDGRDILPKAATPMTAALTKITYAEKSSAKVVFYSETDWTVIEENSGRFDEDFQRAKKNLEERKKSAVQNRFSYNGSPVDCSLTEAEIKEIERKISPQYRACKELTEMAEKDSSILSKLGTEEEISVSNLQIDLAQYVGAGGRYTPIVKWIEMSVANDLLKGIEIVDTPGLGDPIMSRSEKTKEFLMACDLVFVLSPTPQFMSNEDISLIIETLPGESINHAVLVGSKFDSAILDDSARGKQSLRSVLGRTVRKLNDSAQRVISASRRAEKSSVGGLALKRMEAEMQRQLTEDRSLYYISSILFSMSRKLSDAGDLSELEAHILSQLLDRFDGMKQEPEFLLELAGIDRLRNREFAKIRKEKENIIAERSREFIKDQAAFFAKQINEIQSEAEQILRLTETADVAGLQRKLETSERALIDMRRSIEKAFELCAVDTRKYIVDVAHQVKSLLDKHTDFAVAEGSEVETRYREESFLIFFTKEVPYNVTVFYKTANVSDVVRNLQKFVADAERNIASGLKLAIDIGEIRNKIKNVVLNAFQKADAEFDENDVLIPVELVLSKVTIPEFSVVDSEKYQNMIIEEFPTAQVRNEDISRLELRQTEILNKIAKDITAALEQKAAQVEKTLSEQSIHFTDDVKKSIVARMELLRKNISDKEGSILRYKDFLSRVAACKEELRVVGKTAGEG
ncbi:MAG: dynamin family protein [Selenomonadaceae bacterium]|nr:dynamin family protein [Selenomonadaceae bacterium]